MTRGRTLTRVQQAGLAALAAVHASPRCPAPGCRERNAEIKGARARCRCCGLVWNWKQEPFARVTA